MLESVVEQKNIGRQFCFDAPAGGESVRADSDVRIAAADEDLRLVAGPGRRSALAARNDDHAG